MTTRDTSPPDALDQLLESAFDEMSNVLAGGRRVDVREMLPGATDPIEGSIPDEFLPDLVTLDEWFAPNEWVGLGPGSVPPTDLTSIPTSPSTGVAGKGLDFFRSGEAPSNFANRINPLYVARKDFAVAIHGNIEDMFDVSAGGSPGYYRPPASGDAAPGGRSPNSDHYSAGAMDFTGTPENLTRLRNWLVNQPWTSFVRYQSESHKTHVHASIDLGWIAQNYFTGRTVPTLRPTPPSLTVPTGASTGSSDPRAPLEPPREPQPTQAPSSPAGGGPR